MSLFMPGNPVSEPEWKKMMKISFSALWNSAADALKSVCGLGPAVKSRNAAPKPPRVPAKSGPCACLPDGVDVVAGSCDIAYTGTTMTIAQNSRRMTANWQSFSIGQGCSVNFIQPDRNAAVFIRVTGTEASVIQGALTANGKVFLLNQNGVLFSATARVAASSIVASNLDTGGEAFGLGNRGSPRVGQRAIVNQGSITAPNGGTIALIAEEVRNEGRLVAMGGNVLTGAYSNPLPGWEEFSRPVYKRTA